MNRLRRLSPHFHLSLNPLFALESRRVYWGGSEQLLFRYSRRWILFICPPLLVVGLLLAVLNSDSLSAGDFIVLLFAISLIASLPFDFTSVSTSIGSINSEISAGRWDLLRLTSLRAQQIIAAKHGAAQLRAWRWMIRIIALRIAVALMIFYALVYVVASDDLSYYAFPSQNLFIQDVLISVIVILGLLIYILEPFWRMRAVTALGVAISARWQHSMSALAAVGAIFALWLVQGFIILALGLGISLLIFPLSLLEYEAFSVTFCSPLLIVVISAATVYGFYSIVQTWSLRRAERWLARSN